ncbi:hypothetical protein MPNT_40139 [Candidatus Methylacidithermus pantelleriae]|uniref:Uncharacterized protein n=1 Tax=Candidatus Methylacidithermus pantelleriae TaxID=2744239 RepID=A0A8J2FT03_9BACT|nr:hypothetical protein MPNT_40139 [Candidatus Methylacidithermus pantelleriae]
MERFSASCSQALWKRLGVRLQGKELASLDRVELVMLGDCVVTD